MFRFIFPRSHSKAQHLGVVSLCPREAGVPWPPLPRLTCSHHTTAAVGPSPTDNPAHKTRSAHKGPGKNYACLVDSARNRLLLAPHQTLLLFSFQMLPCPSLAKSLDHLTKSAELLLYPTRPGWRREEEKKLPVGIRL